MFSNDEIASFNETEIEMYKFTINNRDLVPYMTIREFALEVHSSPPSVLRFCRKMNFTGFIEFKKACKQELEQGKDSVYTNDRIFTDFLTKVNMPAFQEKLEQAAYLLQQSNQIICAGDHVSRSIAYYTSMYFTVSGIFSSFLDSRSMEALDHPPSALYILFSVSGETEKIIDLACKIKKTNGRSLVITNSAFSTLSKLADFVIPYNIYHNISRVEDHEQMDLSSTQLPVIYIVETIANMFLLNHHSRKS